MENMQTPNFYPKRIVTGLTIMTFAALLLMRNTSNLSPYWINIIFSWEMLITTIGFINMFGKGKVFGLILFFAGGFFLLPKITPMPFEMNQLFWPAIIFIIGFAFTFGCNTKRKNTCCDDTTKMKFKESTTSNQDQISEEIIFSGIEKKFDSTEFKGGIISTIFGAAKINLSQAQLATGINTLEIKNVFGGVELLVPANWDIRLETKSIFGAFEDKGTDTPQQIDKTKTLIIKGSTIFGGGVIKRV